LVRKEKCEAVWPGETAEGELTGTKCQFFFQSDAPGFSRGRPRTVGFSAENGPKDEFFKAWFLLDFWI
jgi:hypothetical protein